MDDNKIFDLIILGGGPAGYYAAERAAEEGLEVLLFEERSLGGVCLNEGCVPTKSLLYASKIASMAKHGENYGVCAENIRIDHMKALERKNNVVATLVGGVTASLKQRKVNAVRARGVFKERTENGFVCEANGELYKCKRLLVCTGSEVIIPPIVGVREGLESGFMLTSREILDLQNIPQHLVIVGGGVIGLELANYFVAAGSNVTVVEMLSEIGGQIDTDIAKNLRKNLEKTGIRFLLETKAEGFETGSVHITNKAGAEAIAADRVLLSIGRRARTSDAGLDVLGLTIERGAIVTDAKMRTNVPGVWAAGDVNGKSMLAHTAYREAAVAINDMVGKNDTMRYDAIPQIIYTYPEAAGVGETEQSATAKGFVFDKVVLPLQYSGRYVAENASGDGFIKLLAERGSSRILGVHMIGSYASEIILSAAIMVGAKWSKDALKRIVFPHPTVGEILRDALFALPAAQ